MNRPSELTPREAQQRFIDDRRLDSTDHTVQSYHYRTKSFVEWCEERDVQSVADLNGWLLDEYKRSLQGENKPVTVKGKMTALKQLLDYLARIDAVDEALPDKVDIPTIERSEETSDVKLATEDAERLLAFYREDAAWRGRTRHVVLELLWNTGCRLGGLRALDVTDYHSDEEYVEFVHRPQTDTPLKNKDQGERAVSLPSTVCDVLDHYLARERPDKRDEHGRDPLIGCRQGRPAAGTIRAWSYLATEPCITIECPHGRSRPRCEYTERTHASKCPSSRSPHQVRTGSITWHRDRGVPLEVTAERVNASPKVIERFYDKASSVEKMENRRREYLENLDFES